jgi:signal transduction histidine kinase
MRRAWLTDLGLMLAALITQSAPVVLLEHEQTGGEPWTVAGYLPVVVSAVPVLLRRLQPGLCLLVSALGVGAYAFVESGPAQPIWYGPLICMYTVAYQAPKYERIVALAATGIGMIIVIGSLNTAIREIAMWSAAYALGALTRSRQRAAAEAAAERERTRIARDLHDILGHAFSVMVVQAESGAALTKVDPERAEQAFEAISETGRDAMAQLRGTVSALRAPLPGLADIPALVARTGLDVRLVESGTPARLSPEAQLAAYRVVQEALTNVIKHAGAAQAEVRMDWRDGRLNLSIVDSGGGHGLAGLRERVAAVGGTVETEKTSAGFKVEAVLE